MDRKGPFVPTGGAAGKGRGGEPAAVARYHARPVQLVLIIVGAWVLYNVLVALPVVGPIVGAVPLLGLLGCFAIASVLARHFLSARAVARREGAKLRDLGQVETPHLRGKLGAALLARGQAKAALEPLEEARRGEPDALEWAYRLGCARLATGSPSEAVPELAAVVARDEEYAYGAALLRLAEARTAAGDAEVALADLERHERNHGPTPEATYRRGLALAAAGRPAESRAAFAEARRLAAAVPKFQRGEARRWALRAWWAGLIAR